MPNEFVVHSVAPDFALVSAILCLGRDWEFQYTSDKSRVAGHLKRHIDFWKKIQAPGFVTSVIDQGFKIPFTTDPPAFGAKNNQSSLQHREFVDTAIAELLSNNCVREISEIPFCRNPPTVASNTQK